MKRVWLASLTGWHFFLLAESHQFFKRVTIEFGCCDMDRRFALGISNEWAGLTILKQSINHERVPAENSLIEGQFTSTVYLGSFLFHDHIEDAKV